VAKITADVIDIGGAPFNCEYLREFLKKIKMTLMLFSGALGKMIHEKNLNKESRDTVPLCL
jgi:hypothetical protein